MSRPRSRPEDDRVLVLAAAGRDGRLTESVLGREGFACQACGDVDRLCEEAGRGVGVVILAEEVLTDGAREKIVSLLTDQPRWSDLPIVLLAPKGEFLGRLLMVFEGYGSVTILERPVQIATLVSAVQAALQARHRQYEVRDLVRQLQETDRRKDEFLAMLGHELRNPLGVLRTSVELLGRGGGLDDDSKRYVGRTAHQIRHLTRMVDDLLDLSRVSRGKISLRREPVDLREVVAKAVDACIEPSDPRRDDVRVVGGDEPLVVYGDPVRLEQVLCNLIQNALKYTPAGRAVRVSFARGGGEGGDARAVVEVNDDGVGIAPEELETVFETFTQVGRSLARSAGGLGLGLALARQLVDLHDGSIEAESAGLGAGATFRVLLPLASPAAQAAEPAAGEGDGAGRAPEAGGEPDGARQGSSTGRVLLVEDLEDAREALADLLRLAGYEVDLAADGRAGLDAALASPPAVALVDIGLPLMDGFEVARRLRSTPEGEDVYLVAMTGYGQEEDRRKAIEAGFDRHLVKPVEPRRLLELLRTQLGPGSAARPERGNDVAGAEAPDGGGQA